MATQTKPATETVEIRQGLLYNLATFYDVFHGNKLIYRFRAETIDSHFLLKEVRSGSIFGVEDIVIDTQTAGRSASKRLLDQARRMAESYSRVNKLQIKDSSDNYVYYPEALQSDPPGMTRLVRP